MNKQISNHKKERLPGQAMIELALILPLLLVLVISTIELGRLYYTKVVITNAAREGAYYLSMNISDYDPGTGSAPLTILAAQAEASNSGVDDITVSVTPKNCCAQGVYSVEVTVDTNVEDLIFLSLIGNVLNSTHYEEYPLSASVEMMVQ